MCVKSSDTLALDTGSQGSLNGDEITRSRICFIPLEAQTFRPGRASFALWLCGNSVALVIRGGSLHIYSRGSGGSLPLRTVLAVAVEPAQRGLASTVTLLHHFIDLLFRELSFHLLLSMPWLG